MDDLFSVSTRERSFKNAPLAVRMRPNSLDEYVGQQKAVGKGSWLRAAIEHDVLSSVILYGPAGTGKTTLAHIIANHTKSEFVEVSAVTGTVKDLRRVIDEAKMCIRDRFTGRTHQIRVHMRHINHACVGDPLYGKCDARADQGLTCLLYTSRCV